MPMIAFILLLKADPGLRIALRPPPSSPRITSMHVAPTHELKALLRLAGPLIASQLAHMLMVLTDTLMMARISPQA
ncbi:hypothetical protein OXL99_08320, partial [Pseudomonas fulva]